MKIHQIASASVALALSSAAFASSLFYAEADSLHPTGPHVEAGFNSFPDMLDHVINANGVFAVFSGQDFDAAFDFLGVENAILSQVANDGTHVMINIPVIGFHRTFTGPSSQNVNDQLKDFFLKSGSDVMGKFLAAIAKSSPASMTDGNPSSSTALMANNTFVNSGFTPASELDTAGTGATSGEGARFSGLGIGFNAGKFEAGNFKGTTTDIALPFKFRLTDRVGIAGSVPINRLTVDGASIYGVGFNVGVPVRIKIMDKENAWNWRMVPLVGISARGSKDLAGGGAIWMAGISNSIDYRVSPKLILCLINQLTFHKSFEIEFSDYKFDPQVDQSILKSGVRAVTPLSPRWIADMFVIETNFLKDSAVNAFTTFGGSLSFKLTKKLNVTLGANYDTGDDYKSWGAGLSSAWKF